MNNRPEILIMMSDQHSGLFCGYAGDPSAKTPCLDRIAADAAVFGRAYTSCPLCVPARASLMTGRYPFSIGVSGNNHTIPEHEPTFPQAISLAGYETVLCGRMHFVGNDQIHGFDKRIAKDICPPIPGLVFTGEPGLQTSYAGADSKKIFEPEKGAALHYDHYAVNTLLDYLEEDHEKPQMIVLGTYMPHWPLCASEEEIEKWYDLAASTLHSTGTEYPCDYLKPAWPDGRDRDVMIRCRAAYYAMIEAEDALAGQVYQAFRAYLQRKGVPGVFVYTSDHGDMIGEKGLNGKSVFFENAVRIPMIIAADGFGHQEIDTPVSLLDLQETICRMAGTEGLPLSEGRDLTKAMKTGLLEPVPVFSEVTTAGPWNRHPVPGFMVVSDRYKLITYESLESQDLLFDLEADPYETRNIIRELPEKAAELKTLVAAHKAGLSNWFMRLCENEELSANHKLLSAWGKTHQNLIYDQTWVFS